MSDDESKRAAAGFGEDLVIDPSSVPKLPKRKPSQDQMRRAAHQAGFKSRERKGGIYRPQRVLRNQQFSVRTTERHVELFYECAEASGRDKFGPVFEEAVELLAKKYNILLDDVD